ncbi:protein ABHD11, partial [Trichonephila inaurata madagascariensis]
PDMVEKLIIEDSTPRNFISGGGKYMSLLMNMAYEIEKIMPTGVDRQTANQFFVDVALQFKSELKLSEETIRNYDADLLPIKWKGDTYAITINIAAVAKALMNDTLQQNLPGTYEGEVLLICGGKSQFKVGSDPLILKYFPKVKKIEFEDAGHFIHNSYPQQFLQEVVTQNTLNSNTLQQMAPYITPTTATTQPTAQEIITPIPPQLPSNNNSFLTTFYPQLTQPYPSNREVSRSALPSNGSASSSPTEQSIIPDEQVRQGTRIHRSLETGLAPQ